MAEVIKMPKMSDTMTEGVIAAWHKKVGDKVKSGDVLAEVETDKATMELESYDEGTLLYIGVSEKEAVPVDGVLAVIGEEGENIEGLLESIKNGSSSNGDSSESEDQDDDGSEEDIDTSDIEAEVIRMPKMSDTMTEGTIVAWHKKEGDSVQSGDLLAEVATDKATMELESYEDGTLLYIGVKEGDSVPVDGIIAIVGEKGANYEALLKKESAPKKKEKAEPKSQPSSEPAKQEKPAASKSTADGRIKASPLAKKLAKEKGINLADVQGSGEHGRIVRRDVESYQPSAKPEATGKAEQGVVLPPVVGQESFEDVPVSQMRKAIGRRVSDSKFTAPHFYVTMEINMDKAIEARTSLNAISPVKISFNDMVIKAVAAALRQNPSVNVSWLDDKMRKNNHIHIGVAMAVGEALYIPVVKFADNKSFSHIAAEVKDFAGKAKANKLQPSDYEGSTFTISNLGMFGVEEFTAIINPPNACILAVGGIKETPVVKNGQVVPGNVMKVTLSCDHRAVDGANGAAFLKTLKGLLEDPVRILV
ncbi:pyruvate dehydrogenase complex dihydrolipoamide acetyltransferase [Cytophagaceae bacterium ABcell3]|nr:pyruvate dehydrogenase complex dihydrolipoamide acetyltransferase [Cytophagaceae bacterium ABcell3]